MPTSPSRWTRIPCWEFSPGSSPMIRACLEPKVAERRSLVLSVDDDAADRALLRKLIPRLGYATIEAKDGVHALELIHERHPDLVLLDVLIPGLDGVEGCRAWRSGPAVA